MTRWKIAFVVGITLVIMGLPLLIIGSTSTGEEITMLIPYVVMFSIANTCGNRYCRGRNGFWKRGNGQGTRRAREFVGRAVL